MQVEDFWRQKRFAVVGVSQSGKGFGLSLYRALKDKGYDVYPVNANADQVSGERSYRSVVDVPAPVDAVLVVVPPAATLPVLDDCKQAGVKFVWLQQGAESDEVLAKARTLGLTTVHHGCAFMSIPGTGFPHSWHRWFAGLTGSRPGVIEG